MITPEYYDNHIVSRWSERWLADDIVWIIGITKNVPYKDDFIFGLIGRTMHILNEHYKSNPKIRFGLIDYTEDELLKMTLIGDLAPSIALLKNGTVIKLQKGGEAYNFVHHFIEIGQYD